MRWTIGALFLAFVAGWGASRVAEHRTLASLNAAARTGVQLRTALLDSEVARFRLMPLALADDRDVFAAIGGAPQARRALDRKLDALARSTGAAAIYVIGLDGRAIAASNWNTPQSFVGMDYSFRRYVRDARAQGAASQFALGTVSHRPGLYLARRTTSGGVVVVKLEFDRIEAAWRRAGGLTYVTDRNGVVVVTSRPDWRFATTATLAPSVLEQTRAEANLGNASMTRLPFKNAPDGRGIILSGLRMANGRWPAQQPGWRVTLLLPAGAALASDVRTASMGAALAVIALAAIAWTVRERSALARQRTAELERLVSDRTASLRHEMDERAASEARAAELREGLRQANRLASLGQITASVAHETAQPVTAIRTYARNSATLLERGETGQVAANLDAIARLTDRIGVVTSELRGFARRGAGSVRPVILAEVIDGAMLILKDQLRKVTIETGDINPALSVLGGKVRLEQVLVNLLQNAVEAMGDQPHPRIAIACDVAETNVRLTVSDNGPGMASDVAARLFTPFVTSRANGLGLGLVIALDIMVDLGGSLRFVPGERGATFEIEMRRA